MNFWWHCARAARHLFRFASPYDFGPRAWNAYLACLRKRGYYFSVDELVTIGFLANSNVAVFQQIGAFLKYEGGFFDGVGPVTACKLASNRSGGSA